MSGSVKLVHDLDVARVNGLGEVNARLVHLLKLTRLGHIADFAISGIQLLGLCDSQVEVDITVALHVIVLNLRADEGEDLVTHFAIVGESILAHGKSLGHANLPLDLVYTRSVMVSQNKYQITYQEGRPRSQRGSTGDGQASTRLVA